jgi:hypothetical protein
MRSIGAAPTSCPMLQHSRIAGFIPQVFARDKVNLENRDRSRCKVGRGRLRPRHSSSWADGVALHVTGWTGDARSCNLEVPSLFTDARLEEESIAEIHRRLSPFASQFPKFCGPLVQCCDGIRGAVGCHPVLHWRKVWVFVRTRTRRGTKQCVTLRAGLTSLRGCDGRLIARTYPNVDAVVHDEDRLSSQLEPRERRHGIAVGRGDLSATVRSS